MGLSVTINYNIVLFKEMNPESSDTCTPKDTIFLNYQNKSFKEEKRQMFPIFFK